MKLTKIRFQLNRFLFLVGIVALFGLTTVAAPVMAEQEADNALETVAVEEKLIRIRDADEDEGDAPVLGERVSSGGMKVHIRSARSTYRKGEAIRLKVKGNKTFYLYLINVNPRSGRGVAILPNRHQTENRIKYPGDSKWRKVPNDSLEFYSDRRGKERIIMVASRRYLDVDRLLSKARSKILGDFFELEAPLDSLDDVIAASYGEKSIKIRSKKSKLPRGVVIKELNLRIR